MLCVRWYLAYGLSLRDLEEMIAERGVAVDHSTIHRWVLHYTPQLLDAFNARKRSVNKAIGQHGSVSRTPRARLES